MKNYRKGAHKVYDFSASSGNITDEAIVEYIANQDIIEQQKDEDFKVWDE